MTGVSVCKREAPISAEARELLQAEIDELRADACQLRTRLIHLEWKADAFEAALAGEAIPEYPEYPKR